jgi:ectoine hydroxylase-related dioxygenase (phytanoyl-CoA dioxygenase family)
MAVPASLSFDPDGAQLFAGAALPILGDLAAALAGLPEDRAGLRLRALPELRPHLAVSGAIGRIAASALGSDARPVRAILFDKSPDTNWALGWHQDRTICVAARLEVEGFGPWTVKGGMHHVEPPFGLLESMATLRVHLDDVPADNAPLLVAPGSHRLGRIGEGEIAGAVRACGSRACTAQAGDIWLYATPILHASHAAARPARRRVLQLDYAAFDLPGKLEWLGL